MEILKSILAETIGLFVDDGSLAFAILFWIGAFGLVLRKHIDDPFVGAGVFLFGCVAILLENTIRSAKRQK